MGTKTRVAGKGLTWKTECRSKLGREGREPGFSAREEMSVVRPIHIDHNRNGAPLSCAVLKLNNSAWQHCTTAVIAEDMTRGGPLFLPNNIFFPGIDIKSLSY